VPAVFARSCRICNAPASGPLSEGVLSKIHIDTAILGVDGISTRAGLTTIHPAEATISADFIAAAQRTIVVADSTKHEHPTFARIRDLGSVSMLVTDRAVPEPLAKALADGGTEVVIATER
jgi:DeoR family transcriptional regulator, aga operon transcriptional repressor